MSVMTKGERLVFFPLLWHMDRLWKREGEMW